MIRNILLVDDDPEIRELCAIEINNIFPEAKILHANDAKEALRKARNQVFDGIWTDYNMPKIMGSDFALLIRQTYKNENVPILIFSGLIEEAKEKCTIKHNIGFANKDFGVEKAAELFKQIIEEAKKNPNPTSKVKPKAPASSPGVSNLNTNPNPIAETKHPSPTLGEKTDQGNKPEGSTEGFFIKTFIKMSVNLFKVMAEFENLKLSEAKMIQFSFESEEMKQNWPCDITALTYIKSNSLEGPLLLGFAKESFFKLYEKLTEEKIDVINSQNSDLVAEILNIIYGNAKAILNPQYEVSSAIPIPYDDIGLLSNIKKITSTPFPLLRVSIITPIGNCYLGLASLKKKSA